MNVYLSRDAVTEQTSSLVVETYDWRHVKATSVKLNGWMRRLVTMFRRVVCKLYTKKKKKKKKKKKSRIMHRTVVKMKI